MFSLRFYATESAHASTSLMAMQLWVPEWAQRFDSPGSEISYILILYSVNWRCKITNWLVNTWEEITELQGLRAHAIVLNPCLHTICHGCSPGLAFDTVVEITHVHCCPADDCAGFFDVILIWIYISITTPIRTLGLALPVSLSPGHTCRQKQPPRVVINVWHEYLFVIARLRL